MRKSVIALGLVGLMGIGYWIARRSGAETTTLPVKVELIEENSKAVTTSIPVRAYVSVPIISPPLEDNDSFRNHINSLELFPARLYEDPFIYGVEGCNEEEIRQRHEKISQRILESDVIKTEECLLDGSVDQLIRLDRKLANCKYRNDTGKFNELLEEIAEHFESTNRSIAAGKIYHFLGNLNKATESFLQHKRDGVEYVLKITPPEELPVIADYYLQRDDPFNAGKVEWFQGNKELGRILMEQSESYKKKMGEDVRFYLSKESYRWAAQSLEELRLPFHRELAQELCQGNEDCSWESEKYRPFE